VAGSDQAGLARRLLWVAFGVGLLLRLIAVVWGDITPGRDGMIRLEHAARWAESPQWEGLSGIWPPLHWYLLGALLRLWYEPIGLARLLNLLCALGTLALLYRAVRPGFGRLTAALATLLLALFWTHISLTASYWVELPYLLLVIGAVDAAQLTVRRGSVRAAWLAGGALALAILLRHEGLLLLVLFGAWLLLQTRRPALLVAFLALPLAAALVHLVEPWLAGRSYFDFSAEVRAMKLGENAVQGVGLREVLQQWVIMPAVTPSLVVVLPGLAGLWLARRRARTDLFAWLFLSQVGLYLAMTLLSTWRPQLRYVMLWFVNLLPYAALAWLRLANRWGGWRILVGLTVLLLLGQAVGWQLGRNPGRAFGWLPLELSTPAQSALDAWVLQLDQRRTGPLKVEVFGPASFDDPWNVNHALLVQRLPLSTLDSHEVYLPVHQEVLSGELPAAVFVADLVLIDPTTVYAPTVLAALRGQLPGLEAQPVHPRVTALLLSDRARLAARSPLPRTGEGQGEGASR
jgi:dolichyl-phosphate-mannose-protein mannosyltransferase